MLICNIVFISDIEILSFLIFEWVGGGKILKEMLSASPRSSLKAISLDFPGGPGVKTPCFQCRRCRLDPSSEN